MGGRSQSFLVQPVQENPGPLWKTQHNLPVIATPGSCYNYIPQSRIYLRIGSKLSWLSSAFGSTWFNELVEEKDSRISDLNREIEKKNKQIEEFQKQQDQAQQIIAMQQKNLDRLTEQNQLLLEASQEVKKVGFWGRLIGQRA